MVGRQPTNREEGIRMNGTKEDLAPVDYWTEHAEAWGNIADAQYEYVGDPAREEFFADLAEAAQYLTEVHFN